MVARQAKIQGVGHVHNFHEIQHTVCNINNNTIKRNITPEQHRFYDNNVGYIEYKMFLTLFYNVKWYDICLIQVTTREH